MIMIGCVSNKMLKTTSENEQKNGGAKKKREKETIQHRSTDSSRQCKSPLNLFVVKQYGSNA